MSVAALAIDYVDQKSHHAFHIPVNWLKMPQNDKEYEKLTTLLNRLIDEVRDDETHPLVDLMEIIGEQLERYDDEHQPPIGSSLSDVERVQYLMQTHALRQKDLIDVFGSQGNVSRFLNGQRPLGRNHIVKLKHKFGVSADMFLV